MKRSDFYKLSIGLVLFLAACNLARSGDQTAPPAQTKAPAPSGATAPATQPRGPSSLSGATSPGVFTALPGLTTATMVNGQPALASTAQPESDTAQPVSPLAATATRMPGPALSAATQPAPALPTPTVACEDGLRYLSDLTIPDGTLVAPGDVIDKRWQVENSGTCNWNEAYRLQRISGEAMGAPDALALYPARSGTQAAIRIVFTAPTEPGTYRSAWQAYNPDGQAFGDPVFVEIIVGSASP